MLNPVKFWLFPAFDSAKLAEGQKKKKKKRELMRSGTEDSVLSTCKAINTHASQRYLHKA